MQDAENRPGYDYCRFQTSGYWILRWCRLKSAYEWMLSAAVWGEPPNIAKQRVDDWRDHLLEFQIHHSKQRQLQELLSGFFAHLCFRLADARSVSTALPAVALATGVPSSIASGFVGKSGVTFSAISELHFTFGIALMLAALIRNPHDAGSGRFRVVSMIVLGTALWHSLLSISDVRAEPLLSIYLGIGGLGFLLMAFSARRSRVFVGDAIVPIAVVLSACLIGAAAHIPIVASESGSIARTLALLTGLQLALFGLGLGRLWLSTRLQPQPSLV